MQKVVISGFETLTGGEYQSVTVNGMGKCSAPMRAGEIAVNGTFRVDGSTECQALTVNGTMKCDGSLAAEKVVCNGAVTVDGDMVANTLNVSGSLRVTGERLNSETLSCTGILTADGMLCCDTLHATGIIKTERLEGRSIRIRSHRPGAIRRFLPSFTVSKIELLRGDELDLSGVTAEQVEGKDVTIGPDCRIESLHCTGTLSVHPDAVVEKISGDYVKK